jgi:hypothetical protein
VIPFLPLFPVSTPPTPAVGTGLSARYFVDLGNDDPDNLTGTVFADRVEGPINWLYLGSAVSGLVAFEPYPESVPGPTNWAAKFSGRIYAPVSGLYTFQIYKDDGACLKIDGSTIASYWEIGSESISGIASLTAGYHDLYLAYKQRTASHAFVQLTWAKPSDGAFSVIPVENLYPS